MILTNRRKIQEEVADKIIDIVPIHDLTEMEVVGILESVKSAFIAVEMESKDE